MLLTAYLDESGTHETSPISVMAGYVGTAAQWRAFDADWTAVLRTAGLRHVHAVDLFKRTKQFKGWPAARVNDIALQLDGVIARHMQLGFSVVIRDDDYRKIYADGPPISKQGDRYLRRILVVGAIAVLRRAQENPEKCPWLTQLLARRPFKVVAEMARTAWALMVHGGTYRAPELAEAA